MDSDGLPLVGPAIDLTKKLSDLSNRLQRVDVTMNILEAKLASIPGLENVTFAETASATSTVSEPVAPMETAASSNAEPTINNDESTPAVDQEPAKPVMTVSKDPRYAKYFQMLKVGVPLMALRPKILAEGLDPDLLETPDAPAPSGGETAENGDDDFDDDASSASSFSDDDE